MFCTSRKVLQMLLGCSNQG